MTVDVWPALFFRFPTSKPGGGKAKDLPGDQAEEKATDSEQYIRCRRCLQEITRPTDRITVSGGHRHTFANPHGIIYEIGCFRSVTGCGTAGAPTTEFTWFSGYSWRIVYCGMCLTHLGWVFEAPGLDRFYGLILKHLAEPE